MIDESSVTIEQDVDKAIEVMQDAGKWLEVSGRNPSKWWKVENLNKKFLLQYADPNQFYVFLVNGEPAGARVIQIGGQNAQDWKSVDGGSTRKAIYLHWGCVKRKFAGRGLPKFMIDFAEDLARSNHIYLLRLDTDANNTKLRKIHEKLGFRLVHEEQENYRKTAFYEKVIE